jgi:DNA-binding GntR family transcriptional regulator
MVKSDSMARYSPTKNRTHDYAALRVYEAIKERLLDGAYREGDKLAVDAIAEEFAVSRYPVMDAIKRLSVEGFVNVVPQVGCRVATYADSEIQDFLQLCIEVGGVIAGLAAERRTPEQLLALDDLSQEIGALLDRRMAQETRARRYRLLNRQFHLVVHDMANSRLVTNVAESMFDRLDFMINTTAELRRYSEALQRRYEELEALRQALILEDKAAARTAYEMHLRLTAKRADAT